MSLTRRVCVWGGRMFISVPTAPLLVLFHFHNYAYYIYFVILEIGFCCYVTELTLLHIENFNMK